MITNYFKTALRNLWTNRFYSLLNMTGLSIGLAVGIVAEISRSVAAKSQ